jgi:hypothetical protein
MKLPRVIGLMPTYNRPEMAHRAAHLWLEQDYAGPMSLLVFDDGEHPAAFCATCSPRVRVVNHAKVNLPTKRNAMMEFIGDESALYFLWDDDDYHGPHRVRRQVAALAKSPACILRPTLYFNAISGELRTSTWVSDGTAAYTWAFWVERRFHEQTDPGSGLVFIKRIGVAEIHGELDYVVVVHAGQRHAPPAFGPPEFTEAPSSAEFVSELLRLR